MKMKTHLYAVTLMIFTILITGVGRDLTEEPNPLSGKNILDIPREDIISISRKDTLDIHGEILDISGKYILEVCEENILELSGKDFAETSGEDTLDIDWEDIVETIGLGRDLMEEPNPLSGKKLLEISGEDILEISGENILNVSRENTMDIHGEISDISGKDILELCEENILDLIGKDFVKTSGEDTLEIDWEDIVESIVSPAQICVSAHREVPCTPDCQSIYAPKNDLSMLMITLSRGGTGYFYPPYFSFCNDVLSYRAMSYAGWTTKAGVTMCLCYRFACELSPYITFTISPSSQTRLILALYDGNYYLKTHTWRRKLENFCPYLKEGQWTKLCLVVSKDFVKLQTSCSSVVLWREYGWADEPVIAVSGVNSYMTDLQMWDSASWDIAKKFMANRDPITGSVLKWSDIGYTLTGSATLETEWE
ncbi:uncharacterized protein LOC130920551 [Corythoichthys intestinalis]|uniref:uncharacterized protein LOC130920551 n=1 Tax=Corythoichthys intestinalis TaxID=161448 RepID=UPI0025A66AEF|nr:uncharacterized protein LOC130920551 [Corythoichthys intestinalis]